MVEMSTYAARIVTTANTTSLTSGPARPLSCPFMTPSPLRGRPLRASLAGARCDAHSSEHHLLSAQQGCQARGRQVGHVPGIPPGLVAEDAADEVQLRGGTGQ